MFRTVGLRYGWLKALFNAAPPPRSCAASGGSARSGRRGGRPAASRRTAATSTEPASTSPGCSRSGILGHLPETDKRSYVDRYGLHRALRRRRGPLPGHDDRRVERLDRHAVQLDPRPARNARSPIATSASSPATPSGRRRSSRSTRSRWARGPPGFNMSLGMMRHGIVKSIGPDVDKILSTLALPRPGVSLPHLGLPAVPQAPPRRGRAARLPVGRLRDPRASSAARA